MATIVKWTMPKSVTEWERKEAQKALRQMLRAYVKWFVILGGAAAYIVYRFYRQDLSRVLAAMSAAAPILPLHSLFAHVFRSRAGGTYSISDSHLTDGASRHSYRWTRLEAYRFMEHPGVPELRCLAFKLHGRREWKKWAFDPREMSEPVLREIMEARLPGRCWDGMPADV